MRWIIIMNKLHCDETNTDVGNPSSNPPADVVGQARLPMSSGRHPFGTIKRGWGFTYTLLKTIPKVETEFSLIFLCYNFKRLVGILGFEGFKKALEVLFLAILIIWRPMTADGVERLLIPVKGHGAGCKRVRNIL